MGVNPHLLLAELLHPILANYRPPGASGRYPDASNHIDDEIIHRLEIHAGVIQRAAINASRTSPNFSMFPDGRERGPFPPRAWTPQRTCSRPSLSRARTPRVLLRTISLSVRRGTQGFRQVPLHTGNSLRQHPKANLP